MTALTARASWAKPIANGSSPPTGDLRCPSESLLKTRVFERGRTEHAAPNHLRATLAGFRRGLRLRPLPCNGDFDRVLPPGARFAVAQDAQRGDPGLLTTGIR